MWENVCSNDDCEYDFDVVQYRKIFLERVPMSKQLDKESVIKNKKSAIQQLNKLLEQYINDASGEHLKKANLISYWLQDYVKYIRFEDKFDPKRNVSYKRGDVVKVGFGFNVGSEYGGLHYAVVLDNHNAHVSPVVTVVPLTSVKTGGNKDSYTGNVALGNDLYQQLNLKFNTLQKAYEKEAAEMLALNELLPSAIAGARAHLLKMAEEGHLPEDSQEREAEIERQLSGVDKLASALQSKLEQYEVRREELSKIGDEIAGMKQGSIALVNQITTISKMRIYDPRNSGGVLYGVSLSEEAMEKINQKVKELYVF